MEEGVTIIELKGEPALFVRRVASIAELPTVINQGLNSILVYIERAKGEHAATLFTRFNSLDLNHFDVEVGVSTRMELKGEGEIQTGWITAGLAAEARYKGAYSAIVMTYNYITEWIEKNGYAIDGPFYEMYPEPPEGMLEEELLTRVVVPVKKR
ncbi:MAG TPA: GyrI-like domain-containing protein [Bacillota bacterium]|nr:GyrI-like domain-containing protein [Bacillota bacterium]HPI01273.1 GyrI-like domain-containing protein [Bacillota bacterium]HPM63306.1 GyrI-like domain-containing protein [Bacillota bacterium]